MKTLEQIEIMFENKKEWRGGEIELGEMFMQPRTAIIF
jgi:hypothetical protein